MTVLPRNRARTKTTSSAGITITPRSRGVWVLGVTLTHQGMLYFRRGLFDETQSRMEESLSILRWVGNPHLMMDVLVHLGIVMHLNGHFERAQALMEEGLACALAGELGEAKRV